MISICKLTISRTNFQRGSKEIDEDAMKVIKEIVEGVSKNTINETKNGYSTLEVKGLNEKNKCETDLMKDTDCADKLNSGEKTDDHHQSKSCDRRRKSM